MRRILPVAGALAVLGGAGWTSFGHAGALSEDVQADEYSYSNTRQFRTTHFELSLQVDFDSQQLTGGVALELQRLEPGATQLVLDTKDLDILDVTELTSDIYGATRKPEPIWISRPFHLGKADPILGRPLIVDLPASTQQKLVLRIDYETTPQARGLHWSVPTAGNPRQSPFLYTLSAPINARSWIPLQDTPRVRATYSAHIHAPDNLVTLMSAKADNRIKHPNEHWFVMDRAVPAQAMALIVADLRFKALGPRSGVYAEKSANGPAAKDFADVEAMLRAGEKLLGAYPWERFDIALMPMNFPVSDVGYPNLATIAPTLISPGRSELAPLAYALAYSWSGTLLAPSEWRDRWLGEAIAAYLAQRMVAAMYGEGRDGEASGLSDEGVLAADLQGRAYDDIFSQTPRRKGKLFFSWLGEKFGTTRIDALLRTFLDRYAGQSVSTAQFVSFVHDNLPQAELSDWLFETGVPAGATPVAPSVQADVKATTDDDIKAVQLKARQWTPAHWVMILNAVPASISAARLAELDRVFKLSTSPSAEVAAGWFALALRAGYPAALWPLQNFLLATGQLALIEPLYEQLMQTEEGAAVARRVYALARHVYHPFVSRRLDEIIKP
jgi:leukotriene-A4 hydrolase